MNKIVGLAVPDKYLQLFTYTREYIDKVGFDKFLQKSKDQFKSEGHEAFTHYFTFRFDDYKRTMVALVFLDKTGKEVLHFTVTAPPEDLETAIEWVKTHNPHLVFDTKSEVATSSFDLLSSRVSVELTFQLLQMA
jgi:hypothetical protein